MPRPIVRAFLVCSLLTGTACTQDPARVDMQGQNYFGHDGAQAAKSTPYNGAKSAPIAQAKSDYKPYQPAPVYTNTAARSTAVRDVPQSTEKTAPMQSIGVSDLAPPSSDKAKTETIAKPKNAWTNKERSESKAIEEKPVAKKEETKPVKLVTAAPEAKATSNFMWPVSEHKIVSGYGPKKGGAVNDGINIAAGEGEPVWASSDGEVVYVGNELKGYGNMVLIKHAGGKSTSYAHLNRATVDKYDRVKQGDIIGYVGSTGNVKSPQLHFAIRDGKNPVDPKKYLATNVAGL